MDKRRISVRLLLKLPLWRVLVVLLLQPIVEVLLVAIFSRRLDSLEAGSARLRGVLVGVELITSAHIVI
mgnify:CR=1 FL=1